MLPLPPSTEEAQFFDFFPYKNIEKISNYVELLQKMSIMTKYTTNFWNISFSFADRQNLHRTNFVGLEKFYEKGSMKNLPIGEIEGVTLHD